MKFKDLHIGQKFNFDHSGLSVCHGLESGPWVKTSARKYRKDTSPFSSGQLARMEHAEYSRATMQCEIGSINTTVIPD